VRRAGGSLLSRMRGHELASRVGSALGLAALALAATWVGGISFALFWAAAGAFFFAEFLAMIAYRPLGAGSALGAIGLAAAAIGIGQGSPGVALGAVAVVALAVAFRAAASPARLLGAAGLAYAACVALPVAILRSDPAAGLALTLWLYAVVWATDIGAFFVGRTLGGPKLWPRVSPKKTWSGFIGGSLIGIGAGGLTHALLPGLPLALPPILAISLLVSLAAHAGDLAESALKRRYDIKDSSQLIPGHGGFMDRLDGFAFASLVALLALRLVR